MSKLCDGVFKVLVEVFPNIKIKKEYSVIYRGQKLFVDIFVPQLNLAIEVHGRQHDEFVEHFHTDIESFRSSKKRDSLKEEWAAENNYIYVVLRERQLPISKEDLLEIISAG